MDAFDVLLLGFSLITGIGSFWWYAWGDWSDDDDSQS